MFDGEGGRGGEGARGEGGSEGGCGERNWMIKKERGRKKKQFSLLSSEDDS